jgi:putative solute:sodium symporter small subunit
LLKALLFMSDPKSESDRDAARLYWRKNVRCVMWLLLVWFLVSYGFGILLVDQLDAVTIPGTGFKLGFWFAQQGSIYVFVVLIAINVWYMNRLDREFAGDESE